MPFYILPFKPFSASFCPLVLGAEIKPPREAHHTFQFSVFSFPLSVYMAKHVCYLCVHVAYVCNVCRKSLTKLCSLLNI